MTFPTDAATITRRKSFGICGPAIVVSSYFLGFIFAARGAHVPLADPSSANVNAVETKGPRSLVLILSRSLSVRLSLYLTVPSGAVLVAGLARWLEVPYPAVLALAGAGLAFLPLDGRARTTVVKIGHRNNRMAEVLSGLSEGDRVVLHPSDRVKEGVAVTEREAH
jgi:multidrug efflux pump subunit AcrA (membrane-fusion protein)